MPSSLYLLIKMEKCKNFLTCIHKHVLFLWTDLQEETEDLHTTDPLLNVEGLSDHTLGEVSI